MGIRSNCDIMSKQEQINIGRLESHIIYLKTKPKRLYLVSDVNDNYCIGVVSDSSKNAKKIGMNHFPETEFIDIRVKWKKGIDISDYPYSFAFDDVSARLMEGVRIGVYDNLEDGVCLNCNYMGYVEHVKNFPFVLCLECIDKLK